MPASLYNHILNWERVVRTRIFSWHEILELKPYLIDILEVENK